MMPGCNGPLWSSCTRRVTRDLDTDLIIEDRAAWEVTGKERRREFKSGGKNTITTFTYLVAYVTKPHQWTRRSCQHCGWLKAPGTCNACGEIDTIQAITRDDICVVHQAEDGRACAWDDVSGNELNL